MADNDRQMMVRASVQMWCGLARVAMQTDDIGGVQDAAQQLNNLALDIAVPSDVRADIRYFVDQLGTQLMVGGLAQLENVLKQFDPDIAALRQAIAVAQAGGANLSIPKAAEAAKGALASFQQLQQAFDTWQQSHGQQALGDLIAEKDQLVEALQGLASLLH